MKTIQDAARAALECQDACNLSGVTFTFARAMQIICDESNVQGQGTEWKNTHPITYLFVDKLADLSGVPHLDMGNGFKDAYDACKKLAEGRS